MKTPWHIRTIGIATLLWSLPGVADFLLVQSGSPTYLSYLTAPERAYFAGFPLWVDAAWALAAFGALGGAILLLLRRRLATRVLTLSAVGMAAVLIYGLALAPQRITTFMDPMAVWFSGAILLVALAVLWYARTMTLRGHLR